MSMDKRTYRTESGNTEESFPVEQRSGVFWRSPVDGQPSNAGRDDGRPAARPYLEGSPLSCLWEKVQQSHHGKVILRIEGRVLERIQETVGSDEPETGGALGMDPDTGTIMAFDFDETAQTSGATYSPDVERLNKIVRPVLWKPFGVKFCGFVHSHPGQFGRPSGGDEVYARNILKAMTSIDQLVMPIVLPARGRDGWLCNPFVARLEDGQIKVLKAEFTTIGEDRYFLSTAGVFEVKGMSIRMLERHLRGQVEAGAQPVSEPSSAESGNGGTGEQRQRTVAPDRGPAGSRGSDGKASHRDPRGAQSVSRFLRDI